LITIRNKAYPSKSLDATLQEVRLNLKNSLLQENGEDHVKTDVFKVKCSKKWKDLTPISIDI
jgi:hypothetical protein